MNRSTVERGTIECGIKQILCELDSRVRCDSKEEEKKSMTIFSLNLIFSYAANNEKATAEWV